MWAVVPLKIIQQSKQRLVPILSPEERKLLSLNMLEDVLSAATKSGVFEQILVVTNCEEALPLVESKGLLYFKTSEESGLNHAAKEAAEWLTTKNIKRMCLFPADIPLAKAAEFRQVVIDHNVPRGMTIVPSHDEGGTNCIMLSPPNLLSFCFGADSYVKHLRQGLELNLSCRTKFLEGISLDIDTPNDLRALVIGPKQTLTQNYLETIGISSRLSQFL